MNLRFFVLKGIRHPFLNVYQTCLFKKGYQACFLKNITNRLSLEKKSGTSDFFGICITPRQQSLGYIEAVLLDRLKCCHTRDIGLALLNISSSLKRVSTLFQKMDIRFTYLKKGISIAF